MAELKPLLHTWSLAVEEQYYVLFPLFLILVWKLGRRWIISLLVLIALISLGLAQYGASHKPVPTFFLLPTRAWELAIGALIAFYSSRQNESGANISDNSAKQILSILGLLLIIGPVFCFSKNTPFPSFYAIIPTFGTALIIFYGTSNTLVGTLLGSRVLVGVGLISYSAYLWHQPLFAFSRNYFVNQTIELMLVMSVTSLILATISWRFVEKPFRNRQSVSRFSVFILSVIGSVLFITIGLSSAYFFSSSTGINESELARILTKHRAVYASNMNERKFIKYRIQYEDLTPNSIVVGSSRIMQIGEHNLKDKVLNLGVSGSSVEDDIAITDMALKKFSPRTLFVSVDPWLFNSESGQNRWKSLEAEYHQAISVIKSTPNIEKTRTELSTNDSGDFNKRNLSMMVDSIYRAVNISKYHSEDDNPTSTKNKIRRDGSLVYNMVYSEKSQKEIERGFVGLLNYAMGTYKFSQESYDDFENFLAHYRNKVNIVLILSPYHPKLYNLMKSNKKIFINIEEQFRELATRLEIKIIGSYDPSRVNCSEVDFYDGMHPRGGCMERVISELSVQ